ncbi:MAG: 4Fe-4S ferredoxin [Deltaproteobacteria bacterium]|nr:MAG: 4Fe-4S ferredoxin [Deltaproteobacteria bacterium]
MKTTRKIIEIDDELCNGCGQCVPDCAEGSLQIIDGKARLVADNLCDGLGACLGSCPTGALKIIEREADAFDEKAVDEFLARKKQPGLPAELQQGLQSALQPVSAGNGKKTGCPSASLQTFPANFPVGALRSLQEKPAGSVDSSAPASALSSTLSNWPVQIRLIPPEAPFLKGCDLLVAADCTAVSYPEIQQKYIAGRVVMMGCPKFDDQEFYEECFRQIFLQSNIKSLTCLIMEVPCCHTMISILERALQGIEPDFSAQKVVVTKGGAILEETNLSFPEKICSLPCP